MAGKHCNQIIYYCLITSFVLGVDSLCIVGLSITSYNMLCGVVSNYKL